MNSSLNLRKLVKRPQSKGDIRGKAVHVMPLDSTFEQGKEVENGLSTQLVYDSKNKNKFDFAQVLKLSSPNVRYEFGYKVIGLKKLEYGFKFKILYGV